MEKGIKHAVLNIKIKRTNSDNFEKEYFECSKAKS